MRYLGLAIFALLPLIQSCDSSSLQQDSKIVSANLINGSAIEANDPAAKFTILLRSNSSYCTGSLIAPNIVLTAAHCFNKSEPGSVVAVQRAQANSSVSKDIKVRHIFRHPKWKFGNDINEAGDVALLELERPVNSTYKPIALYDGPLPSNYESFPLEAYGYSLYTENSSIDLTDYFKDITRDSYTSGSPSNKLNGKLLTATDSPYNTENHFIFAEQLTGGMCSGDSGGPMVVNINGERIQIGVFNSMVSTKGGDIDCSSYSIAAYLQPYLEWINKTLRENKLAPIVPKTFATSEAITNVENPDTYCVYAKTNDIIFLESVKEQIVNNVCDKNIITELEKAIEVAAEYCTTDLARNYQDALKATLKSVSANCQAEVKD